MTREELLQVQYRVLDAIDAEWDEECSGNRNTSTCEVCRAYSYAIGAAANAFDKVGDSL